MAILENATVTQEHPVMRWGAVWAGWLLATGIAALLYAFGLAIGFSAFDPHDVATVARGVSGGAITWMILTWAASLWLGAMFASWFDGRNDSEMGVIRGLAVWGLSLTATTLMIASGMTHLAFVGTAPTDSLPALDADDSVQVLETLALAAPDAADAADADAAGEPAPESDAAPDQGAQAPAASSS